MTKQEAYEILLERIRRVFGNELKTLSETQGEILNGLILDRVEVDALRGPLDVANL
jgi:hypothetical protein